jgi:hypothetical protein
MSDEVMVRPVASPNHPGRRGFGGTATATGLAAAHQANRDLLA